MARIDAMSTAGAPTGTIPGGAGRYVYHCPLRWSDLDAYGHVNNARFLTLYEEARVALMFVDGRAGGVGSFAEGVVIARHEIDYLRPVDYPVAGAVPARHSAVAQDAADQLAPDQLAPDQLAPDRAAPGRAAGGSGAGSPAAGMPSVRIELWVEDLRSSRFTLGYELFDREVLAGRARSVLVPFDLTKGRPRRLTDRERDFLLPYLTPAAGAGVPGSPPAGAS